MAFNGRFVLNIIHFASNKGVDVATLLDYCGKTVDELGKESCIIEDEVYNNVIENAAIISEDPYFGLHASENLNLAAAGLISQLTHTAETVKQALEICCEYANLGCSALPMKLVEEDDFYKVIMTPSSLWQNQSPAAVRHTAEGILAFTIREFHSLTRMKHFPIAIHLPWQRPNVQDEYERVFGCPVQTNKSEIAILLRKEHVEDRVITSDYTLFRILVAHAEERSAILKNQQGFVSIVRQSMVNLVKPEFPTIEQVASHLNISARTLQRRLKEEGYSYKELIDELRKEFAISYLKRRDLSISEIAYLLSYAEASAFSRSFKRWTGKTPGSYQNELLAKP